MTGVKIGIIHNNASRTDAVKMAPAYPCASAKARHININDQLTPLMKPAKLRTVGFNKGV